MLIVDLNLTTDIFLNIWYLKVSTENKPISLRVEDEKIIYNSFQKRYSI